VRVLGAGLRSGGGRWVLKEDGEDWRTDFDLTYTPLTYIVAHATTTRGNVRW
jgi:hypothetical protein